MNRLPERFQTGPQSEQLARYIARKYSTYGFRKNNAILFNPEWEPEQRKCSAATERYRWVEHPKNGLRFVGKVDEIRGSGDGNLPYFERALVDHKGWYIDNFHDETVAGQVYQLPARDGKNQYVPAVEDAFNDAAILDFHAITDDLRDAIRCADAMAERYAEDAREYEAKDRAETRIEEIDDEVKAIRAETLTLCREIRENCKALTGLAHIKAAIRSAVHASRRRMAKLTREKRRLQDDYWTAVPNL